MNIVLMPKWLGKLLGFSFELFGVDFAAEMPTVGDILHEMTHDRRQRLIGWTWYPRYTFSKAFRLNEEAIAFAAEPDQSPKTWFAGQLASWHYCWAAPTTEAALAALENPKE